MSHKKLSERLEERLSKEVIFHISLAQLLVLVAIAAYAIVFSYASILKYMAFRAYGRDLGVFAQAFWTTLHGKFFFYTADMDWNPTGLFFGLHFSPLMFVILAIYAIFSQPQTLLVLQSFVLGLAAMPLYMIARHELKSYKLSLLIVGLYLINPGIASVNLYDFHLEAFLPLFFLFAFYYFLTKKWIKYTFFIALAMFTLEYACLIAIFFGAYWLIVNRNIILRKFVDLTSIHSKKLNRLEGDSSVRNNDKMPVFAALATIISAAVIFFVGLKVISLYGPTPLVTSPNWPYLGSTFSQIVLNLFNPSAVAKSLAFDGIFKLEYLLFLFASIAFLSIFSPAELVMALPWFIISLLSTQWAFFSPGWQYFGDVTPFLLIGAIYGIKKLKTIVRPKDFVKILVPLLAVAVLVSVFTTPLDPLTWNRVGGSAYVNTNIGDHEILLQQIVDMVPANASILTLNNIFPHFSNRADVYMWYPLSQPQYILYDVKSPELESIYQNVTTAEIISTEVSSAQYGTVASIDGIVLLEKGYTGDPLIFQPFTAVYNFTNLDLAIGRTMPDSSSISKVILYHPITSSDDSTFWYGPYIALSPGWYQATFRIMTNSTNVGYVMTLDATSQFGIETLAEQQVYGHNFVAPLTWTNITMDFYIDKITPNLEFRGIQVSNETSVYLDLIQVQQISKPTVETPIYVDLNELFLGNGIMNNNLFIHSPQNESGMFWYGPYTTLDPGVYNATLWLKDSSPQLELLLNLDATADSGRLELASRNITNIDFQDGGWQAFSLIFQLNATTPNIEFRGDILKDESVMFFSNIELYKVG